MLRFDQNNIQWLLVLIQSVGISIIATVIPRFFQQTKYPRTQNGFKLLRECLARHQLAYFTYFLAQLSVGSFDPTIPLIRTFLAGLIVLSFFGYIYGLYKITIDEVPGTKHQAPSTSVPPKAIAVFR